MTALGRWTRGRLERQRGFFENRCQLEVDLIGPSQNFEEHFDSFLRGQ